MVGKNSNNIKSIQVVIDNSKETKRFFKLLISNKNKNPKGYVKTTLNDLKLPINSINILIDQIGDTEDLSTLNPGFLTPSLIDIKKKQEFIKEYQRVLLTKVKKSPKRVHFRLHKKRLHGTELQKYILKVYQDCTDRFYYFDKFGLYPKHSIQLSGMGDNTSKFSKDVFLLDPKLEKYYNKRVDDKVNSLHRGYINPKRVKELQEYYNLLIDLNSNYKIKKEWRNNYHNYFPDRLKILIKTIKSELEESKDKLETLYNQGFYPRNYDSWTDYMNRDEFLIKHEENLKKYGWYKGVQQSIIELGVPYHVYQRFRKNDKSLGIKFNEITNRVKDWERSNKPDRSPVYKQKKIQEFLTNNSLQNNFFSVWRNNGLKSVKKSLNEVGLPPDTIYIVESTRKVGDTKLKEKFIKKFRDFERQFKIIEDEDLMDEYIRKLIDCEGSEFQIGTFHYHKIRRFKVEYPKFKKRIYDEQIQIRDRNFKKYVEGCEWRYKFFIKRGLLPGDCMSLSGIGKSKSVSFSKLVFKKNPKFEKFHQERVNEVLYQLNKRESPFIKREKKEEYLKVMYEIQKTFVIKPEWIGKFDNKTKQYTSTNFTLPNYKRIYKGEIQSIIKRIKKDITKINLEIPKWKKKQTELRKVEERKQRVRKRRIELNQNYTFNTNEKLLQYENYFQDLEDQFIKNGNKSYSKSLENLSVKRSTHFFNYRNNYEFRIKTDDLIDRVSLKIIERKKEYLLNLLVKNKGDIKKTFSTDIDLPGPHQNTLRKHDPYLSEKIHEIQKRFTTETYEEYVKKSLNMFDTLIKKGVYPGDSVVISGFGGKRSGDITPLMKRVFGENKKFFKRFHKLREKQRKELYSSTLLTIEQLDERKNYIDLLKSIKTDFIKKNKTFFDSNPFDIKKIPPKNYRSPFIRGTSSIFPVREHYFIHKIEGIIFRRTRLYNSSKNKLEKHNKTYKDMIPNEWKSRVKFVSSRGSNYFDINRNVIFRKCSSCDQVKDVIDFFKTKSMCKSCMMKRSPIKKKSILREKWYRGKLIRRYDELGNEVLRRCNSCDTMIDTKRFKHKYKGSSVCDSCYVDLPNNHLTKRGEFWKGEQIRWYDEKTFKVIKRRCSICKEVKSRGDFLGSSVNFDGISRRCKKCYYGKRK
jgi:hypothetical protein